VIDEISTSAYISLKQRQQEAKLILASPRLDTELDLSNNKITSIPALHNSEMILIFFVGGSMSPKACIFTAGGILNFYSPQE